MKTGIYIINKEFLWHLFIAVAITMFIFMLMRQDYFAGIFSGVALTLVIILFGNEYIWEKKQKLVNEGLVFEK